MNNNIDKIVQSLENLDISKLHPCLPEIISNQATINIGTIGHVAHGKTTLVRAISGVHTIRHKTELVRNITIKLGYANAKIYECKNPDCPRPDRYSSSKSSSPDVMPCSRIGCKGLAEVQRHVSFVDCPGHDILMATMLNGAAVMDAAFLLIAGNEPCPQPQTKEHLAAIQIMKLKNILILQNKVDLIQESKCSEQHDDILNFIKGTLAEGSPVMPISAQLKINIDSICDFIVNKIPIPLRDYTSEPRMIVIRSFDVDKPGCEAADMKGGIAGGSLIKGVLRVGQRIEIRPGIISKDNNNSFTCRPIISTIVSLYTEQNSLQYAVPGGLIGVGTNVDPQICRADRLVGQVLGCVGQLPQIFKDIEISFDLMKRILGVKSQGTKRGAKIDKLQVGEMLMVNIGSLSSMGKVEGVRKELAKISLNNPVCTEVGEKMALSRKIDKHWRLIGWGEIRGATQILPSD